MNWGRKVQSCPRTAKQGLRRWAGEGASPRRSSGTTTRVFKPLNRLAWTSTTKPAPAGFAWTSKRATGSETAVACQWQTVTLYVGIRTLERDLIVLEPLLSLSHRAGARHSNFDSLRTHVVKHLDGCDPRGIDRGAGAYLAHGGDGGLHAEGRTKMSVATLAPMRLDGNAMPRQPARESSASNRKVEVSPDLSQKFTSAAPGRQMRPVTHGFGTWRPELRILSPRPGIQEKGSVPADRALFISGQDACLMCIST